MPTVFVSYARTKESVDWVKRFIAALRKAGLNATFDEDGFRGGKGTLTILNTQALEADWLVVVCDPEYRKKCADANNRTGARIELDYAVERIQDRPNDHRVLVVLRKGTRVKALPPVLAKVKSFDAQETTLQGLANELTREIQPRGAAAKTGGDAHKKSAGSKTGSRVPRQKIIDEYLDRHIKKRGERDPVMKATFAWLRADERILTLETLDQLSKNLRSLPRRELAAKMLDACKSLAFEHPSIHLRCNKRAALLEYEVRSPRKDEVVKDQNEAFSELGAMLAQAFICLGAGSTRKARRIAQKIATKSLEMAGVVIMEMLGGTTGGQAEYTASLMMPLSDDQADEFQRSRREAKRNAKQADAIFGEIPRRLKLVVVAEAYERPTHLGFWVPVLPEGDHRRLPGATEAFSDRGGSAVHKSDLPILKGFDPDITKAWHDYMKQGFAQWFFVSLRHSITLRRGGPPPVAVINVNVNPHPKEASDPRWFRLLHEEWRRLAGDRLARFSNMAVMAYSVVEAIDYPNRRKSLPWEGKGFKERPWRDVRHRRF